MDLYLFFTPSPIQILVVLALGVLFFGKNLPEVVRQIGLGLMELRKGMSEVGDLSKTSSKQRSGSKVSTVQLTESMEEMEKYELVGKKFEPPTNSA